MDKTISQSIYDVSQNKKKQICLKVNLPYDMRYLTNLNLICGNVTEKNNEIQEDNLNYQAVSEKLFCNSCNINFSDYHEMRKHQWTRNHRLKNGMSVSSNDTFLDDDNDDSDEIINVNDDEEIAVDDDNDDDQDSDENNVFEEKDNKVYDTFNNCDYISALKTGKISFNEVCSFPTVYFQNPNNEIIGIKRCVLFKKKNKPENPKQLMGCVDKLLECQKFAVFLYSGGCFAGAIFEGNKKIVHKTIKRYTYRRQQGGSQITKDNQGHPCKSGGAYLRRVNTQKLVDDVFQLLHQSWAEEINKCGLIFIWSAKSQRHIFGHEGMFNQSRNKLSFDINKDDRVRFICARVSKVNSSTLMEVYREIITIEIYDQDTVANFMTKDNQTIRESSKNNTVIETKSVKNKSKKPNHRKDSPENNINNTCHINKLENDNIDDRSYKDHGNEPLTTVVKIDKQVDEIRTKFLNYVLNDSAEDLEPYIEELRLTKSVEEISILLSTPLKTRNQSLLHLAVNHNNVNVICHLLKNGCDPVHRNIEDETPYAQAIRQSNKVACKIMTDYMYENPTQYDYHAAKFPGGKDPLREQQKCKQQNEKKKQYKKDRKQRLKLEEEERKKEAIEKCQRDQFLALTNSLKITHLKQVQRDQGKRFLLCFQCATNISDIVPFSYSDYSFCCMDCLKIHRLDNEK